MGHKPSATAEKHYTVRPLDLLRLHHEKIEAWILKEGEVSFFPEAEAGKFRAVKGVDVVQHGRVGQARRVELPV